MRIIHCSDIHLDSKLSANLTGAKKRERKLELIQTFERMVEYADAHNVSAIIIAGDLFDTRTIAVTPRKAVYKSIVNHPGIEFYYLRGNHDADSFLGALETVPDNLRLFGDTWTTYTLGDNSLITINGVELNGGNAASVYSSLVLDVDKINIVTLHGQESEYQKKDRAEIISINELRGRGIDYLALGHIHEYKLETLDRRGNYCYSGCLEGRGFDECGEHGFVMLNIDEASRTIESEFIPFAKRSLYTVPVDITDCMDNTDIREKMYIALEKASIGEENLVKVELMGNIDIACEMDTELLTKTFEDDYYFIKVKDNTKLAVNYNDFSLDASLKGEFVRLVMGDSDMDEELKARIIRCGIQALAGEEI